VGGSPPAGARPFLSPCLPGGFQFGVAVFENLLISSMQPVRRRHIADGAVQPHRVVMVDEIGYYPAAIFQ
jgi:hypothetical protein